MIKIMLPVNHQNGLMHHVRQCFWQLQLLPRNYRTLIQLTIDFLVISIALELSVNLTGSKTTPDFGQTFLLSIFLLLILNWAYGVYALVVRTSPWQFVYKIFLASITYLTFLLPITLIFRVGFNPAVYISFASISFTLMIMARLGFVAAYEKSYRLKKGRSVLICGDAMKGAAIKRVLDGDSTYQVEAFISNDPALVGRKLTGVTVYDFKDFDSLSQNYINPIVLLVENSVSTQQQNKMLLRSESGQIEIRTIPNINQLLETPNFSEATKSLTVEDILCRDVALPVEAMLRDNIDGKRILVSGAGGSIGSQLCIEILQYDPKVLYILDLSEIALFKVLQLIKQNSPDKSSCPVIPILGNCADKNFIFDTLAELEIDSVLHAAAYKHVDLVEKNNIEGARNNILSTYYLVNAASQNGVKNFTLVSSDKAVHPSNMMGLTKRLSELVCLYEAKHNSNMHTIAVRFGNVLRSSGSVVPIFEEQIERGGPLTLTDKNATRFFMSIQEAAQLVIQAMSVSKTGDILLLDLATKMIKIAGKTPKLLKNGDSETTPSQIGITITGLKKGEKLHETINYAGELKTSKHTKILISEEAKSKKYIPKVTLKSLISALEKRDIEKIELQLKIISETLINS